MSTTLIIRIIKLGSYYHLITQDTKGHVEHKKFLVRDDAEKFARTKYGAKVEIKYADIH